jgi:UDP-N-acetylglucosamine--dolichyl-phosphate N-acetylglucosaminephosphotransferase
VHAKYKKGRGLQRSLVSQRLCGLSLFSFAFTPTPALQGCINTSTYYDALHSLKMTPSANELSRSETASLLVLSAACVAILANTFQGDGEPLAASVALSGLAFSASYAMIRWLGPTFIKAGLKGMDLSKLHRKEIPECMGAVCAVVYILIIIVFTPFPFYKDIVAATSGGGNRDVVLHIEHVEQGRFLHRFPHSKVR